MKNIITFTLTMLTVLVSSFSLVSAPVTSAAPNQQSSYQDAELLAQAFLQYDTDHYNVSMSVQKSDGSWLSINAVLDGNLFVTNMTINNTVIPITKPLAGIPIPAEGYLNVGLSINAMDKYNNTAATGQYNTNYLAQGVPIFVMMTPQFPPTAIKLQPGLDQNSLSVMVIGSNGWGWSYDSKTGLLTISTWDVSTTDLSYVVKDGSGGILAHGSLPLFQAVGNNTANTNSVFNLHNDGGVMNLPLGDNGYNYFNNQPFDSIVSRNGTNVSAKVSIVPDVGYKSKLYINCYGLGTGTIEVRKWSATGVMDKIPCTSTTDSYGNTTVVTGSYVDRVVITQLPGSGKYPPTSCNLWVTRTY